MPKKTGGRYTEEFKAEAVQLARSSPERSIRQLAYELGIAEQTLRNWIKLHRNSRATYGAPRVHAELRAIGIHCRAGRE